MYAIAQDFTCACKVLSAFTSKLCKCIPLSWCLAGEFHTSCTVLQGDLEGTALS